MTEAIVKMEVTETITSEVKYPDHPEWLTKEYLESMLQNYKGETSIRVKSIIVKKFDGSFASVMYRVIAEDFEGRYKSYIFKCKSDNDLAKKVFSEIDIHQNELDVYQKVLPEFKNTFIKAEDVEIVFPELVGVDEERHIMILQDMMGENFSMRDRIEQLDAFHVKQVLKQMAKFHAASAVEYLKDPTVFENFNTGIFNKKCGFNPLFTSMYSAFETKVSEWKEFGYFSKKLRKLGPSFIDNVNKLFEYEENDFYCLNHGDLWTNNILFRYNSLMKPIDAIFLDFQFCVYASPAIDLLYFLGTSSVPGPNEEMERYIKYYHTNLCDYLSRFGYDVEKIPTLHQLQLQVFKRLFYYLATAFVVLPLILSDDSGASFENLHCDTVKAKQFKKRVYANPQLHGFFKHLLAKFDLKGLLYSQNS